MDKEAHIGRWIFWGVPLFCLWGMAAFLLTRIDAAQGKNLFIDRLSYLPSGKYLRIASLEFKEAVADLLWLRAVQFIGGSRESGHTWFYHAIDRITDLEPNFIDAYKVGSITLSLLLDYPDLSIRLLEKGVKENPNSWELPFYLGFNYSYHKNDPRKAAAAMEKASFIEGHPPYLPLFTARLYSQGGDHTTAVLFLKGIYLTTQDEKIRVEIAKRIAELEDEISKKNHPMRGPAP